MNTLIIQTKSYFACRIGFREMTSFGVLVMLILKTTVVSPSDKCIFFLYMLDF